MPATKAKTKNASPVKPAVVKVPKKAPSKVSAPKAAKKPVKTAAKAPERVPTTLAAPKNMPLVVGEHYEFHQVAPATGRAKKPTPLPVFVGRVVNEGAKAVVVKVISKGQTTGTRTVPVDKTLKVVPLTRDQAFGDLRNYAR